MSGSNGQLNRDSAHLAVLPFEYLDEQAVLSGVDEMQNKQTEAGDIREGQSPMEEDRTTHPNCPYATDRGFFADVVRCIIDMVYCC